MSDGVAAPLVSLAALMAAFTAAWLLSLRLKDVGIVDIIWGPGFALVAWVGFQLEQPEHSAALLVLIGVTLWALRLTGHLWARHRMSTAEDPRYAAMRAADPAGFPRRSLVMIFWLQAVILWALALPIHLAMGAEQDGMQGVLSLIGCLLFAAGLTLQSVADWRLLRFRRSPANRGRLLTDGVFAWSRHPNYFGECLLWFGIALMAWDASGTPLGLLGPAALTFVILRISGPPLLEPHLKATRPDYAAYAERTSAFVPWPPKK
jgi:steroid 5-alpha reductase family enzyme